MESELLKDVDNLHDAFRIHVDGDPDNRSVLVLAQDKEDGEAKVMISCCGNANNIVDCILMFLENDNNKSLADAVAAHFLRKDRTLKRMAMWTFFISLGWLIFLVWFYFLSEYGDGSWIEFVGVAIIPAWAMVSTGYLAFRQKEWIHGKN